jgi:hypothetical protein
VARAAAYLSRVEGFTAQHVAGAAIELTPGLPLEILNPRRERALSLAEARTTRAFELAEEGFYELRRGGGRSELLAVNADRRESDLALAPRETLDLWMKSTADPRGAAPGAAPVKRVDLWPYLLVAAILITLAESFVGSRYLAGRAEPLRKGAAA